MKRISKNKELRTEVIVGIFMFVVLIGLSVFTMVLSRENIFRTSYPIEVVFDDVVVEPGAKIKHAIIDKEAQIRVGTYIGYDSEADGKRGCTISERGVVVVPKGMEISPI